MTATQFPVTTRQPWSRVRVGSAAVAAADRDALGTTARVVVWPPGRLASLLPAVDHAVAVLGVQASRFHVDPEISAVHTTGTG
ncbi:MAG: hypothetical protein ACR2FU_00680, partial [Streptosporangiaceae bacterium]